MAVNDSRSQNKDLRAGITDGSFKNLTPDRGGVVEDNTSIHRNMVLQGQYGVTPRSPLAEVANPVIAL